MSGIEIERKFLVKKGGAYKSAAFSSSHIVQGYIPCDAATVRIRIRDEKAYLTIKGKSKDGIGRYEFEKEIEMEEARNLMNLCSGGVIDKRRYLVKSGNHVFEVDEFIGPEVTGDKRFYNKHMLKYPFSLWREDIPQDYR